MARIIHLVSRILRWDPSPATLPPAAQEAVRRGLYLRPKVERTNKWGAALPVVPAGRMFDERVRANLSARIDDVLEEAHSEESPE